MTSILFILSGLPDSGKSTLSKFIAKKHNAFYLRIDTANKSIEVTEKELDEKISQYLK